MENLKIVIAGGTGALGKAIVDYFDNENNEIIILSRQDKNNEGRVRYIKWDATYLSDWQDCLVGADVVINLVGKSVNCRYTEKNKKEIIRSRVAATKVIGEAIENCTNPPKLWVNAGSAAIFGNSGDDIKYENSIVGDGFSPEVCKLWEKAFFSQNHQKTRKVFLRIGLVLQKNKGVLKPFIRMAKFGLGGKLGSGEQYMSWIHELDFVNLIDWIRKNESLSGIVHASSPYPVKNHLFMETIRKNTGALFGFSNPALLMKFGAIFIGTEAELVLSGRRVVSKKLKEKNYNFKYPRFDDAIANLLNK